MPYAGYRRRYDKWSSKFDPDTIRSRFMQVSAIAKSQAEEQFARLVDFETAIKNKLNDQGVPVIQMPFYLNVGREAYRAGTKHSGKTLQAELDAIKAKWVARGLNPDLIDITFECVLGTLPTY